MATFVLVHEIAQEQKSADALEEEWLPDLTGGVRTAGFPEPVSPQVWTRRDRHEDGLRL